jgi:hypothetical protein
MARCLEGAGVAQRWDRLQATLPKRGRAVLHYRTLLLKQQPRRDPSGRGQQQAWAVTSTD